MKNIYKLLFCLVICLQNCERDDICAEGTQTTPLLLVEFYDINSTEDLKSVPRLTAYGENLPDPNPPESEGPKTLIFNTNTNALALPLLIGNEGEIITSRFVLEQNTNLRLDENDTTTSNTDIIEISYIPEFLYVSRACGYKSIFTQLNINLEDETNAWISAIEIVETTIENENTVHVRIFH